MNKFLAGILLLLLAVHPSYAQAPPIPSPSSVLGGQVLLSVTTSSTRVALPSTVVSATAVTIYNKGSIDAYFALGTSSVAATTSSTIIPAGTYITIWKKSTDVDVASITASSTTTLIIYQANGPLQFGSLNAPGGASPIGAAGGDLTGTYPNPNVAKINGSTPAAIATSGSATDLTTGTTPCARNPALTGDVTVAAGGCVTVLANIPAISGANLTGTASGLTAGAVSGAGVPYGTSANTAAQGNDSRITGAAQQTHISSAWTPADASGASLVFTGVSAKYTTIGNMNFVYAALTYPTTVSGSTAAISGLPSSIPNYDGASQCFLTYSGTASLAFVYPPKSTSSMTLFSPAGAAVTNAQMSGVQIFFECIYPAT